MVNPVATEIEELEIDLLLEAIERRYGYDFRDYARASVRRKVRAIAAMHVDIHIPRRDVAAARVHDFGDLRRTHFAGRTDREDLSSAANDSGVGYEPVGKDRGAVAEYDGSW